MEEICLRDKIGEMLCEFAKEDNRIYMIYGNHDIIKERSSFYTTQYRALKKVGEDYGKHFLNFIKDIEFYDIVEHIFFSLCE